MIKNSIAQNRKSGGFSDRLLESLLKTRLSLIRNVLKPLTKKSVLIPLGLTAAASATLRLLFIRKFLDMA